MKEIIDIDFDKLYFKVTNEDEIHNGLAYHDGIVEDTLPFNGNPMVSCVPGRIYITDADHMIEFYDYNKWIRPCYIVGKDAFIDAEGDRIGVHSVRMLPRMKLSEWFDNYKDKFNYKEHSWALAKYIPERFDEWKKDFNYEEDSWALAVFLPDKFHEWEDDFNYKEHSWALAECMPEWFDEWEDRFNYKKDSLALAKYMIYDFEYWKDRFIFRRSEYWEIKIYVSRQSHLEYLRNRR